MNKERLQALAKNAANAMLDKTLTYEERAKITNPKEVGELGQSEYWAFQQMMIEYMRELVRGEK